MVPDPRRTDARQPIRRQRRRHLHDTGQGNGVITLEQGLYLRVLELENGPKPFPLQSGFTADCAYRAMGLFNPSETSDAYFILSNDRDEVWFICNRHLRTVAIAPGSLELRKPLKDFHVS